MKALIGKRPIRIEIDGGVSPKTAPLVTAASVDVLVAGAAIFQGGSVESLPREYRGDQAGGGQGQGVTPLPMRRDRSRGAKFPGQARRRQLVGAQIAPLRVMQT